MNHEFEYIVATRNNIFTPWKRLASFKSKEEAKEYAKNLDYEEVAIWPV